MTKKTKTPDALYAARLTSRAGVPAPEDNATAYAWLEVLEHLDNLGPLEAWRTIAGWLEDGYEASVPAHALDDVLEHLDELHAATEKATGEMAALRGAVVLADPVAVFGRLMLADPQKWLRRFETDAEEAKPPTPEDVLQVERFIRAAEALEAAKPAVT